MDRITCTKYFLAVLMAVLFSCHSPSQKNSSLKKDLSKVKIGMEFTDVLDIVGAPDTIVHRGIVLDTFQNQTKTDEWHYGNNQIIVIVNDTVNAVDPDAEQTQRRIDHIIDSARNAEGNSNPFVQPSQQ